MCEAKCGASAVLVTGGGGSIGSSLVLKLIESHEYRCLVVVDISEFNLYRLEQVVGALNCSWCRVYFLISDIRNTNSFCRVLQRYNPAVVYHAAALKHVPLLETEHNAVEAVSTNIGGTQAVFYSCSVSGVKKFILISTDKAVEPASLMGATKTYAEGFCREMSQYTDMGVIIVRFGNVMDSSGSVLPKFREQIKNGGPVTVTHPGMRRFFMSIDAAVFLVISAAGLGEGTYILDMGEEVFIKQLAETLIKKSGKKIAIVYTGMRPGEKCREVLFSGNERPCKTVVAGVSLLEGE